MSPEEKKAYQLELLDLVNQLEEPSIGDRGLRNLVIHQAEKGVFWEDLEQLDQVAPSSKQPLDCRTRALLFFGHLLEICRERLYERGTNFIQENKHQTNELDKVIQNAGLESVGHTMTRLESVVPDLKRCKELNQFRNVVANELTRFARRISPCVLAKVKKAINDEGVNTKEEAKAVVQQILSKQSSLSGDDVKEIIQAGFFNSSGQITNMGQLLHLINSCYIKQRKGNSGQGEGVCFKAARIEEVLQAVPELINLAQHLFSGQDMHKMKDIGMLYEPMMEILRSHVLVEYKKQEDVDALIPGIAGLAVTQPNPDATATTEVTSPTMLTTIGNGDETEGKVEVVAKIPAP